MSEEKTRDPYQILANWVVAGNVSQEEAEEVRKAIESSISEAVRNATFSSFY